MRELYSKDALNKLRSPERLDSMFTVVSPLSWISLSAVGILLIAVVVWSIFGAMVDKVQGKGILLDPAGITKISSLTSGRVHKILVNSGVRVKKGDIIAIINSNEREMLNSSNGTLDYARSGNDVGAVMDDYNNRLFQANATGVITSDFDGIVEEVNVGHNKFVTAGSTICTIRRDDGRRELAGVMYVPAETGHKIEPGMTLQLVPSGFDATNDGQLLAVVRSVSRYPVSIEAVSERLGNDSLAAGIMQSYNNAVLEVNFELLKDKEAPSGYLWTSLKGPNKTISSGRMVTGFAVTERMAPIEKVFYKFNRWVRTR